MGKKKATGKKGTKKGATQKKPANKKNKPASKKKGNPGGKTHYGALITIPASPANVKKIPPNGPPFLSAAICARGPLPALGANETVTLVACVVEKPSGPPLSYTNSYVPPAGATTWSFDPVGGVNPMDPNGTLYFFKLGVSIQNSVTLAKRVVTDSQRFQVNYQPQTDCGT